jgi:O-antigen ligase
VAQAVATRDRVTSGASPIRPALGLAIVGLLATLADVFVSTGAWFFAITAVVMLALVVARPEVGIAVFLSTFMVTYPTVLAGSGYLTINNVLGLVFLVLLAHRVYVTRDRWFLRNRELWLLAFVAICYYTSAAFNGPEPRLLQLIGEGQPSDAARLYVNRVAFVLFFVNFIRTPPHVRLVYLLCIGMMVASVLVGVWGVLQGGGLYGYRASTFIWIIAASGNPNRLAMFAIISLGALWYLRRQVRNPLGHGVLVAIMVLLVLGVFMAASRSGLLGLLTSILFILYDEGVSLRRVVGLGLGALMTITLVLRFVPEKSLERVSALPGSSAAAAGVGTGSLERRQYTLEIGYEIARENLLLGVGVGNWEITRFMRDPARSTAPPHSSYLLAMAEGGLFCLLAFLALFWRTWRNFTVARERLPPPRRIRDLNWIVSGARVGLLTLVVFSLFADLWQSIVLFWLVGLGVVLRRYADSQAIRYA